MFPYPSGAGLHVGHPEGYTATDILARYWRMRGFDVLHPMGWDAFGLPAEQHAIKTGTIRPRRRAQHRDVQAPAQDARLQLRLVARGRHDPSGLRPLDAVDFLQLFDRGLAYQEVTVNWCPALGTVLANEGVIDGKSERGGHPVHRVPLRHWTLRITAYADRLSVDYFFRWSDTGHGGTLTMQRDWIGRSGGAEIVFGLQGRGDSSLEVFTTVAGYADGLPRIARWRRSTR